MTARPAPVSEPVIDIGLALDLLASAATQGSRRPLVHLVLSLAGVDQPGLRSIDGSSVRDLYARGVLPVRLTLGASEVLHAAQRSQARGETSAVALAAATSAACRYLDLLDDDVFSRCRCGFMAGRPGRRFDIVPPSDLRFTCVRVDEVYGELVEG